MKYNPTHQNLVDTSLENNPTCYEIIPDVPVWSIFKRKRDTNGVRSDGNPLVFAFKGEKRWTFASENDKNQIINQMQLILDKFSSMHQGESTIVIPSTHGLNAFIAEMYIQKNPSTSIIDDVIWKMSTDEVYDECANPCSQFMRYYGENANHALAVLSQRLDIMDKKYNTRFVYHEITDGEMRNQIQRTLRLCDNALGKYGDLINDKHILIINDTISRGATIKQTVKIIQEAFIPKSITVLTMFSPL